MLRSRLFRRVAAAVVAATLSVGGVAAVQQAQQSDHPVEEAGATWSSVGGGFGGGTNGATWS